MPYRLDPDPDAPNGNFLDDVQSLTVDEIIPYVADILDGSEETAKREMGDYALWQDLRLIAVFLKETKWRTELPPDVPASTIPPYRVVRY